MLLSDNINIATVLFVGGNSFVIIVGMIVQILYSTEMKQS